VLQELGVAAAPTFERLVREAPDEFKPVDEDPLVFLVRCVPERASVVCRDLLSQPGLGFLVAKRVMRAMSAQPPVLDPTSSAWRVTDETGTRAPTLVVTGWRDVTTALLGIPVAASEALIFAQKLSQYDALDAPLRAALVEVARSDDESLHFALARPLNSRGLRPSVEPLLVELLDTPSAEVRAVAAEELARGPRSERLLAKFADPDPRVRASIANALEPVQLQRVRYSRGGHTFEYTTVERAFDERDRPLLDRLLADGSPDVRTAALQTASSAKIRLTPEIVERLSKDPDAAVRRGGLAPPAPGEGSGAVSRARVGGHRCASARRREDRAVRALRDLPTAARKHRADGGIQPAGERAARLGAPRIGDRPTRPRARSRRRGLAALATHEPSPRGPRRRTRPRSRVPRGAAEPEHRGAGALAELALSGAR